jgi:hypothetical protein
MMMFRVMPVLPPFAVSEAEAKETRREDFE